MKMLAATMKRIAVVITAFFALALPAQAQSDPTQVLPGFNGPFLKDLAGLFFERAELQYVEKTPVVVVVHGQRTFVMTSYDCEGEEAEQLCRTVNVVSFYKGPYGVEAIDLANQYHGTYLFGRGYLDQDRDLVLDTSFRMGGVTAQYVTDVFTFIRDELLNRFETVVVSNAPPASQGGISVAFDQDRPLSPAAPAVQYYAKLKALSRNGARSQIKAQTGE